MVYFNAILTFFSYFFSTLVYHVDSWILISRSVINESAFYFNSLSGFYPPGSFKLISLLSSLTGLDILIIRPIFLFVCFVLLGFLFYSISKTLFKNKLLSLVIGLFVFLVFTNMTMLGPRFFVPLTFGILLCLLFLYFILKEKWVISLIIFISLVLTHASTTVFTLIFLFLYFLFNREYWDKLKYFVLLVLIALVGIMATKTSFFLILKNFFMFSKSEPYYYFFHMYGWIFFILLILGFLLILIKEEKARKFLIPIFVFLALDICMYWYWQGVLLVYRKLLFYLTLLVPFFVGYSVYFISINLENILVKVKKLLFIRKFHIILVILLILLVPYAISLNNKQFNKNHEVYVRDGMVPLLEKFSLDYSGEFLVTNELMSYSLAYYNLKPVQLTVMHGFDTLHLSELNPIYWKYDQEALNSFMLENNYTYLFHSQGFNESLFKEIDSEGLYSIYEVVAFS